MSSFAKASEDSFLSDSERKLVRAEGIEPSSQAWEARILPIYDARKELSSDKSHSRTCRNLEVTKEISEVGLNRRQQR
jgi:hypothetical protein